MRKRSKRLTGAYEQYDKLTLHSVEDAFARLKSNASAKFDESVDVAVKLGVNPRHADQMVRGAVVLPNGLGKTVRVLVFATGEKEKEALEAGADFVGGEDIVEKIKNGWTDFDAAIAIPPMMAQVGKVGKILGPRGLMPNPKTGTVTMDVANTVREAKAGKVQYRVEKAGIVHAPIGKASFDAQKLIENFDALMNEIHRAKPSTAKGTYVKSVTISTTMGPGIKIDPSLVKEKKE
ncbi:MAG: 50S ribosomal protein L1 [Deltaproteobacteria bacterium]|nr:50S ribosomal protein L1 [Deltaproteobacteria bacterium]MBN2672962.1 50S ribosomal protein L1 [Deltaproteobacteria bacterium]